MKDNLITISAIQMSCLGSREQNIDRAIELCDKAIDERNARVILLPELFERQYFCQERNYSYYDYAEPIDENMAVKKFVSYTEKKGVTVIVSVYEKCVNTLYNSVAVIDSGKVLGVYRKTHIPDDHLYQEKFYFTPGNTGFKVFDIGECKIGIGICWDQWFPEVARSLALNGADFIFYPTAIGSEPILDVDSKGHWQRTMQGHSAANLTPVIAANRYGVESVTPSSDNLNQSSSLSFYGSSFITDNTGDILKVAQRSGDEILSYTFDVNKLRSDKLNWGLFRDRRPHCYKDIVEK